MEMWKTAASPMENRIHGSMEKSMPFPQPTNAVSHSAAHIARLPTVPQRLLRRLPNNPAVFVEKEIISCYNGSTPSKEEKAHGREQFHPAF